MYSWVAVEGEPIPLKEAYTHDDARTMNQVVEHFTSDLREQFWGRSGPTHAAELARLLRPAVSRCPRISISVSGSMNGVQRGPMPGTACMSATLSRVLAPCESAWLGCGSGTSLPVGLARLECPGHLSVQYASRRGERRPALCASMAGGLPAAGHAAAPESARIARVLPRSAALWRTLRTTNVIERCCVEVRRRTRPMVCVVNVQSVERIIFSIVNRFNLGWRLRTFGNLHTSGDITYLRLVLDRLIVKGHSCARKTTVVE